MNLPSLSRHRQTGMAPADYPIPAASLRYRISLTEDIDNYLEVGKHCAGDIESALARVGYSFPGFRHVLDFGCGPGRTIRWFASHASRLKLDACDVDAATIAWCRANLPFARFVVNEALPPLPYPSGRFDLVYVVSVFSHLPEDYQFEWLAELRRVCAPGGLVLLSLHGEHFICNLPAGARAVAERAGFLRLNFDGYAGLYPQWYQNTFHTQAYVRTWYAHFFDILDYIPRGLHEVQDMVILRKPSG